ncbi:RpiB/LacA/LacB family sugar-phosphate isomerase [Candidatus Neptunichlamydia sp. REUL1]|uniref:RpiB/LacA/LacB family sugar-phosphate isomerase n=1 Tax=Candidatus Neptunichlamydia sp. REUL1 TaxID=3064277 RepID=UPI002931469C|nr:RpiB/LacA/LacB family sugar-phosphate isomerase [Candidatus Neptunochlamydia sp. REUL1]
MGMKIAISSDEYRPIIDQLIRKVESQGHQTIYFGPEKEAADQDWTTVTRKAIQEIHEGKADEGIVLCWTGTGCTILSNKFPGIRAALCVDGETAKGARIYNHANVLGLSLRLLSSEILQEILDQWFSTPFSTDAWNLSQIKELETIEKRSK